MLHRRRWRVPHPRAILGLLACLLAAHARAAAPSASPPELPSVTPSEGARIEEPPVVTRITFAEAIQRALARNPTVAVARADVERADALVNEARAGWFPTLVGSGSYTLLDHDRTQATPAIPIPGTNPMYTVPSKTATVFERNQLYGNLTLTVPLVAAQGWTAERQAKDNRHIAELSAADVRRQVAYATGAAFITVIAQRLQLRSNETAIVNAKDHANYAHTRLLGGIGRSIDDVRAQQDLATVLANRQAVLTGLARAREALGVLVGSAEPLDAVEAIDFGPLPGLSSALEEATRRSDIATQEARIGAAERVRKDVWAYYAPYLAAVAQPFAQSGEQLHLLPNYGWQVGLVLTLPLYDGGQRTGLARQRDAELAETRLELEGDLRQARSEVRVAFEAMLRADEALASAEEAATLARRAYELAVVAYKAGATTNIEVLDAARQSRDADSAAAAASDVARRARLDLLVASGRFP
jgi:outer membrane protein TolC